MSIFCLIGIRGRWAFTPGERYYMCFGCNTIPSLLKDLLTKIEEFGLPIIAHDDDGIPLFLPR